MQICARSSVDRVADYESVGRGFESLRAHHRSWSFNNSKTCFFHKTHINYHFTSFLPVLCQIKSPEINTVQGSFILDAHSNYQSESMIHSCFGIIQLSVSSLLLSSNILIVFLIKNNTFINYKPAR